MREYNSTLQDLREMFRYDAEEVLAKIQKNELDAKTLDVIQCFFELAPSVLEVLDAAMEWNDETSRANDARLFNAVKSIEQRIQIVDIERQNREIDRIYKKRNNA